MAKSYRVAIVGATGAVGIEMLKTLENRKFPVSTLKLLASVKSAGKTFQFNGKDVVVEELIPEMSEGEHSHIGVIFFAVGFTLMMALDVALG